PRRRGQHVLAATAACARVRMSFASRNVLLVGVSAGRLATALAPLQLQITSARNAPEALPLLAQHDLALVQYPDQLEDLFHAAHTPVVVMGAPPGMIARLLD